MLINQLREITGIQDPETLYKALNVRTRRATDVVPGSKTKQHLLCIVFKASWFHTLLNAKMLLAQTYNPNTCVSQSTKIVCVRVSDNIGFALHFTAIKCCQKGNMTLRCSNNQNMFTELDVPAADLVHVSCVPRPAEGTLDMPWDC